MRPGRISARRGGLRAPLPGVMMCVMSSEQPDVKPRWWKLLLIPTWIANAIEFFGVTMLVAFPLAVETPEAAARWAIFATVILFSLGYGLYAGHRIRRTVVASDEVSYTVRLEWVRRGSPAE